MKKEAVDAEKIFHSAKYPILARIPPVVIAVFPGTESGSERYRLGLGMALVKLDKMMPHEAEGRFNVAISSLIGDPIAANLSHNPIVHILSANKGEKSADPLKVISLGYKGLDIITHARISIDRRTREKIVEKVRTVRAARKGISLVTNEREHIYIEILKAYKDAIARELWKIAKKYSTAN